MFERAIKVAASRPPRHARGDRAAASAAQHGQPDHVCYSRLLHRQLEAGTGALPAGCDVRKMITRGDGL